MRRRRARTIRLLLAVAIACGSMSDSEATHSSADEAVRGEVPAVRQPVYRIDERPTTWWESVLYGWQHTLVDVSPFVASVSTCRSTSSWAERRRESRT